MSPSPPRTTLTPTTTDSIPPNLATMTSTLLTNRTHRRLHHPLSSTPHFLLTLVVLCTLLTLATPVSFEHLLKNSPSDCQTNMHVSAICYHCAALDPARFYDIHNPCCAVDGRLRQLCRHWYTEEPKRGRRDVWYY